MGFLRRVLGGDRDGERDRAVPDREEEAAPERAADVDDEAARDRELMREEARRLDDDLLQRQLRYADRSWTPPAQGGERRADDADGPEDGR